MEMSSFSYYIVISVSASSAHIQFGFIDTLAYPDSLQPVSQKFAKFRAFLRIANEDFANLSAVCNKSRDSSPDQ